MRRHTPPRSKGLWVTRPSLPRPHAGLLKLPVQDPPMAASAAIQVEFEHPSLHGPNTVVVSVTAQAPVAVPGAHGTDAVVLPFGLDGGYDVFLAPPDERSGRAWARFEYDVDGLGIETGHVLPLLPTQIEVAQGRRSLPPQANLQGPNGPSDTCYWDSARILRNPAKAVQHEPSCGGRGPAAARDRTNDPKTTADDGASPARWRPWGIMSIA